MELTDKGAEYASSVYQQIPVDSTRSDKHHPKIEEDFKTRCWSCWGWTIGAEKRRILKFQLKKYKLFHNKDADSIQLFGKLTSHPIYELLFMASFKKK